MSGRGDRKPEISRLRRVLRETSRLAEHASLTGSLSGGMRGAVQQVNSILRYLEESDTVPRGLFRPLEEDASVDSVGITSAQLAAYLEEEDPESRSGPRVGSKNVIIGGFSGLNELQNLGEVIREHLPEWMRTKTPPKPPEAPAPEPTNLAEAEARLSEVGARLQEVAEQLGQAGLTDSRRAELAEQLSRYGQEQARLARLCGTFRAQEGAASHPSQ